MSQELEMKTTDVDAAKRFIAKNDQKKGYRLQCPFGCVHPTINANLRFPTRKSLFEALDEIDRSNIPSAYAYHHLPRDERMVVCDMLHETKMRETICTFEVNISKWHGEVSVGITVDKNPVWTAMRNQWMTEREEQEAKEAADAGNDEEEE